MAKLRVAHRNTEQSEFEIDNDKIAWIVLWNNKDEMQKFFPQPSKEELREIWEREHEETIRLREQSYANAEKIIDRCQVDELTWLLNDLWDYNAKVWLDNPDMHGTIGHEVVMETGFTSNQKKWIKQMYHILQGDE